MSCSLTTPGLTIKHELYELYELQRKVRVLLHSLVSNEVHIPCAFKKDAKVPTRCIADGVIGYSPEGIASTWKVC